MHRPAIVAIAALLGSMVIGCGQTPAATTAFSDRQIFEGAVFGAGPVAALLPEARDQLSPELYVRNPEALAAMADARAAIIDELERAYPGLISSFGAAARSGDPARVRAMLSWTMVAIPAVTNALTHPEAGAVTAPSIRDQWSNVPVPDRAPAPSIRDQWSNVPVPDRAPVPSIRDQWSNVPVPDRAPVPSIREVNPGWDRFASGLLADQLASSIAITFGTSNSGS